MGKRPDITGGGGVGSECLRVKGNILLDFAAISDSHHHPHMP